MSTENYAIPSPRKSTTPEQLLLDIHPDSIVLGDMPNREPFSPKDRNFQALANSVRAAGGNVQPVKVRLLQSDPPKYELIYGHRRVLVCRYLNLNVQAIVASSLSSIDVLTERVSENLGRVPFRPIELGRLATHAVQSQAYPSLRKFAEAVDIDPAMISKAAALAQLPEAVLRAFPSVLQLQYSHAKPLADAALADPAGLAARAEAICKLDPRPSTKIVFCMLLGRSVEPFNTEWPVRVDAVKVGDLKKGNAGITISLSRAVAPPDLDKFLASFEAWLKATLAIAKASKTEGRRASGQIPGTSP